MESIGGLDATGRRVAGPAADLVEMESAKGLKHTAIVFNDQYKAHPAISSELQTVISFMEQPNVEGVLELREYDPSKGVFVYSTGTSWSFAEVVQALSEMGEVGGIRAALEFCYQAAQALDEASERGERQGLYNHGSFSPWRVVIQQNGQVRVIGFGLPSVDLVVYREDETRMPSADGFRYAPPERITGEPEDISSDLFTLALMTFELMMGRPMYDGLVDEVRQQASRAEGARKLYQLRSKIPESVREVLSRALKYDMDARHADPIDFIYEIGDILETPDCSGDNLIDVMRKVREHTGRSAPIMAGRTGFLSKKDLEALRSEFEEPGEVKLRKPKRPRNEEEPASSGASDEDGEEDDDEADEIEAEADGPSQPRWGKSTRSPRSTGRKRSAAPPPEAPKKRPASADDLRSRLRKGPKRSSDGEDRAAALRARLRKSRDEPRRSRSRDEPSSSRERASAGRSSGQSAKDALRDRLRSSRGRNSRGGERSLRRSDARSREPEPIPEGYDEEPVVAPEPEPEPPKDPRAALLERLRGGGDKETEEPTPEPVSRPVAVAPKAPPPTPAPEVARPAREAGTDARFLLPGGREVAASVDVSQPLAEIAWRLSVEHQLPRTDLLGNLATGYVLEQDGRRWPGDEGADALDLSAPVLLAAVANTVRRVVFEVEGEPTMRFSAPIGQAVPAGALLAHLVAWLGLDGEGWEMVVDDVAMQPYQLLADFADMEDLTVVVRR